MIEGVIREVFTRLGVVIDPTDQRALEAYNKQIDESKRGFIELGNAVFRASLRVVAWTTTAVAGAIAAGTRLALSTARVSEEVVQQAAALQLTTDAYQELSSAFRRFGADNNDVADALGTLTDRSEDALGGMQTFIDDFRLIGIEVDDLRGRNPEQLFELFTDRVAQTEDRNAALAATVRILGDDLGRRLNPLLQSGAEGLAAMRQEAHDLGDVLSTEQLAASNQLARSWRDLLEAGRGLRLEIGAALAPMVERNVRAILDWVRANRELLSQRIQDAIGLIGNALNVANKAAALAGGWDAIFLKVASGAGVALLLLNLDKILLLFKGIRIAVLTLEVSLGVLAAGAGLTLGPFLVILGAIIAAFVLWGLAIDDIVTFFRGGDSVLGHNLELIKSMIPFYEELAEIFRALVDVVDSLFDAAVRLAMGFVRGLSPAVDFLVEKLDPLLSKLRALRDIWRTLVTLGRALGVTVRSLVSSELGNVATALRGLATGIDVGGVVGASAVQASVAGSVRDQITRNSTSNSTSNNTSNSTITQNVDATGRTPGEIGDLLFGELRSARQAVQGRLR